LKIKNKILKLILLILIVLNMVSPIVNAQTCVVGEDIALAGYGAVNCHVRNSETGGFYITTSVVGYYDNDKFFSKIVTLSLNDEIILYKPLKKDEIEKILDLLIKDLNKRLEDKQIEIKLTDKAKKYLIDNGYDAVYGARPLKRFVQKKLETLIAIKILEQVIVPKSKINVDFDEKELTIL